MSYGLYSKLAVFAFAAMFATYLIVGYRKRRVSFEDAWLGTLFMIMMLVGSALVEVAAA